MKSPTPFDIRLQTRRCSSLITQALVAAMLVVVLLAAPRPALAIFGDPRGAFGLDGSFRVIGAVSKNYDFPAYFQNRDTDDYLQGILRLTAAGEPTSALSYEVHLVGALTYTSMIQNAGGVGFAGTGGKNRYRALEKTWNFVDESRTSGDVWLDRFNVKIHLDKMDITLGRQAVTFGKAFFWNPLDIFLPFDPAQFDRDYKAGVDALRLDFPLGAFSGLTLVYVAGRELTLDNLYDNDDTWDADWTGSAVVARYFTNVSGWDLALQGGKIYGGYQLGGALSGELGGLELRAEAAWFTPEDSPKYPWPLDAPVYEEHVQAVFGIGRRFENSLHLEAEILYNGAGECADQLDIGLLRQVSGSSVHMGRWLAAVSATYEFTPLITGQLAVIHSLTDHSTQVQPTVTVSVNDNSDLIVGASLNFGPRPRIMFAGQVIESEFGAYPHTFFVEFKTYF